jgi:hypothetical protein
MDFRSYYKSHIKSEVGYACRHTCLKAVVLPKIAALSADDGRKDVLTCANLASLK